MTLLETLKEAQKDAMRAKDKLRLGTIRMTLAAVKQREIDERIELTEGDVLAIVTKMVKQRKDAAQQFADADRLDLADKELEEIVILESFLPQPLTPEEIDTLIATAISDTGAAGMQDMGKVMGELKKTHADEIDFAKAGPLIKELLNS